MYQTNKEIEKIIKNIEFYEELLETLSNKYEDNDLIVPVLSKISVLINELDAQVETINGLSYNE